jgi:hypothetical protein
MMIGRGMMRFSCATGLCPLPAMQVCATSAECLNGGTCSTLRGGGRGAAPDGGSVATCMPGLVFDAGGGG